MPPRPLRNVVSSRQAVRLPSDPGNCGDYNRPGNAEVERDRPVLYTSYNYTMDSLTLRRQAAFLSYASKRHSE